jgi:hypothetical protein
MKSHRRLGKVLFQTRHPDTTGGHASDKTKASGQILFQVENYRAEGGYKISPTSFSKDAFLDNRDTLIARQSATRRKIASNFALAAIGSSAASIRCGHFPKYHPA